jgi:hypothetical protein
MPQSEARAWWADVQDVRESIERRRADDARWASPAGSSFADRHERSGEPSFATESLQPAAKERPKLSTRSHGPERPRVRTRRAAGDHLAPVAERRRRGESLDGPDHAPALPAGARRTVQITGRPAAAPVIPRLVEVERRRPNRAPADRIGPRPDRVALWAVLLAFFLILVAATSSHAAVPAGAGAPAPAVAAGAAPVVHVAHVAAP